MAQIKWETGDCFMTPSIKLEDTRGIECGMVIRGGNKPIVMVFRCSNCEESGRLYNLIGMKEESVPKYALPVDQISIRVELQAQFSTIYQMMGPPKKAGES